jgi:hypothetical protein
MRPRRLISRATAIHRKAGRLTVNLSNTPIRGIVHGKTIELEIEPGLPDGQHVAVTMKAVGESTGTAPTVPETEGQRRIREAKEEVAKLAPGEGLRRSFGAWAEDAEELDEYLAWNRENRKLDRPEIEP